MRDGTIFKDGNIVKVGRIVRDGTTLADGTVVKGTPEVTSKTPSGGEAEAEVDKPEIEEKPEVAPEKTTMQLLKEQMEEKRKSSSYMNDL